MGIRLAINGFGRIGRSAFKIARERRDIEIVAINDTSDSKSLAHLLKYDSNYGTYDREVSATEAQLTIDRKPVQVYSELDPAKLPWKELDIDVVLECTGHFTDPKKAKKHLDAGAKKVVISAPAKTQNAKTIVLGVNETDLKPEDTIISCASCTTNCIAPIMKVLEDNYGVEKAMMTTTHSYTASQRLQDAPAKDLRESRAAAENIIPTTTGASQATGLVLPAVKDNFIGLSIRVPTPVVSLADFAVILKKATTIDDLNKTLRRATKDPYLEGIIATTTEPLVSSDFKGASESAIVDLGLTNVVGGNFVKIVAWYDNEWGYSNRLIELAADFGKMKG